MSDLNEQLLSSWIKLCTTINNERIVSALSFNETMVCNILRNQEINNPTKKLTATDLCNKTGMLKSLMNRTLNTLEKKDIIQKECSTEDRRQIFVSFNEKNVITYEEQHRQILELVDVIIDKVGRHKINDLVNIIDDISNVADIAISEKKKGK